MATRNYYLDFVLKSDAKEDFARNPKDLESIFGERGAAAWRDFESKYHLGDLFMAIGEIPDKFDPRLEKLIEVAKRNDPGIKFDRMERLLSVRVRGNRKTLDAALRDARKLVAEDSDDRPEGLEPSAGLRGYLGPPSSSEPSTYTVEDPHVKYQSYLEEEETGCIEGWQYLGGRGENVRFCDVEAAWNLKKEESDLPIARLLHGKNNRKDRFDRRHGNNSVGVVCANTNHKKGVGICHQIGEATVSSYVPKRGRRRDELFCAIIKAACHLAFVGPDDGLKCDPGNILLIEVGESGGKLPVEVAECYYWAIRIATAVGIIVIEPAGNGGTDIEDELCPRKCFGDPRAILVGALHPKTKRILRDSSRGDCINAWAWGRSVYCYYPMERQAFGQTSAASAIVAGCAAMVQSLFKQANPCEVLSPCDMRSRLQKASHDRRGPKVLNIIKAIEVVPAIHPKPAPNPVQIPGPFVKLPDRRRVDNKNDIWTPPLTPHEDPPFERGMVNPVLRGGACPTPPTPDDPNHPTEEELFNAFVIRVIGCAESYNRALYDLKQCHLGMHTSGTYPDKLCCYRKVCAVFAGVQNGMGELPEGNLIQLVDPDTIFIEPRLSNGYIIDVSIVAHPAHPETGLGAPNYHSESSLVSTNCSTYGSC